MNEKKFLPASNLYVYLLNQNLQSAQIHFSDSLETFLSTTFRKKFYVMELERNSLIALYVAGKANTNGFR